MEAIYIHTMQENDLKKIILIEESVQKTPWTETMFSDCLHAKNDAWVIKKNDELIGYAIFSCVLSEAELLRIGLKKEYQRKGIGKIFWSKLLVELVNQGIQTVFLEVRKTNQQAIEFYQKIGFQRTGIRKNYYKTTTGREDAYFMQYNL